MKYTPSSLKKRNRQTERSLQRESEGERNRKSPITAHAPHKTKKHSPLKAVSLAKSPIEKQALYREEHMGKESAWEEAYAHPKSKEQIRKQKKLAIKEKCESSFHIHEKVSDKTKLKANRAYKKNLPHSSHPRVGNPK